MRIDLHWVNLQGYYADPEAECQAFHICANFGDANLVKYSFLCPNGTLFNQQYFICDWWFNVDCSQAEDLYGLNEEVAAAAAAATAAAAGQSKSRSRRHILKKSTYFLKFSIKVMIFEHLNIWLTYLTELLSGDANGAGSETLSTYTALGADVSNDLSNPSFLLESLSFNINVRFNIVGCKKKTKSYQTHFLNSE